MDEFTKCQLEVETIMRATADLDRANDCIEAADLSGEEQGALWLWAWHLLPEHRQRQEALAYLQAVRSHA